MTTTEQHSRSGRTTWPASGRRTSPTPSHPRAEAARGDVLGASGLNVLAGVWLIVSPFVLSYGAADATWNPIVFGAIVGVAALARMAAPLRSVVASWANMAIGVWLFVSAFWLADTAPASWNVGIMGIVVFVLAALSATAGESAFARTRI